MRPSISVDDQKSYCLYVGFLVIYKYGQSIFVNDQKSYRPYLVKEGAPCYSCQKWYLLQYTW